MEQSKIKILPDEKRKIVENGMRLSRIQKVIDVINKAPEKELIIFIDVRDNEIYNIFDVTENKTELPLDGSLGIDLKITKNELNYLKRPILDKYYSILGQQYGEIVMLEMSPK